MKEIIVKYYIILFNITKVRYFERHAHYLASVILQRELFLYSVSKIVLLTTYKYT